LYSAFQKDGDMLKLWIRNLGYLVKCRSLQEVLNHPCVDEPIKLFMRRDTFGYFGRHFSLVECRGPFEFLISDAFPTVVTGNANGILLEMYSIFPLSPKRALLSVCEGVENVPLEERKIRERIFIKPNTVDKNKVKVANNTLSEEETGYINNLMVNAGANGFVSKSKEAFDLAFNITGIT
ncbi:MAG: hypothetical protein IKX92_06470, partial [Clostridia bacterium]|nr:hypothetical protein [Clostridia bacterium]